MILKNNTILITGGSSGIGFQLSKILVQKGNTVIICGKSLDKLNKAKEQEPKLITYQCDLSDNKECAKIAKWLLQNHPNINILINNAAVVNMIDFLNDENSIELAENFTYNNAARKIVG